MKQEEIERIVQEVVQRLAAVTGSVTDTLVVQDRLVTLATVEDRLQGIRRVQVDRRAVVTPAVMDELKSHRIELSRHAEQTVGGPAPTLFMAKTTTTNARWTSDLPCAVSEVTGNTLEEIIANMRVQLPSSISLGAIVTAAPEQAVCLANRHAPLRAFHGLSVANVERAVATLAANVIVLEAGTSSYLARRMLAAFVKLVPRPEAG
jgi:hypothetical protein